MRRTLLAGILGALLILGVAGTAAALLLGGGGDAPRSPTGSAQAAAPHQHADHGKRAGHAEKDKSHHGHGSPAWAADKAHGSEQGRSGWKTAWQALTPAERSARMEALAQAHAEGMEQWRSCVAAAGDNRNERAACEKPLPPGQAKRSR